MKYTFQSHAAVTSECIVQSITNFSSTGHLLGDGQRNKIKIFTCNGVEVAIKSFKKPNWINQVVYRFFRPSKANRSYHFATLLQQKNIGTPTPIAYWEEYAGLGLQHSYYACEHLNAQLTFRELVEIPDYPEHAIILQQFMHFCFELHEKGVEFLDHSPGNTLIVQTAPGHYQFYLVDLNRMQFHEEMSFEMRMKNLSRLTPKQDMVAQMSAFYAEKFLEKSAAQINERLWFYTQQFQEAFARKKRMKQRLKFWK
ncbi:MAG: hypothetical protein RIT03_592 [Bacteroidota bacterium]|jgi:hypothetical protein